MKGNAVIKKLSYRLTACLLSAIFFLPGSLVAQTSPIPSRLLGCWWGHWDIPLYGGECYIGLNIESGSSNKLIITFHRITKEDDRWTTSKGVLEKDMLFIPAPRNCVYKLHVNWENRTMDGVFHTPNMDIPTHLRYSPEITEVAQNPDFFKKKSYAYRIPEQTGDGLDCGALADAGLDMNPVKDMMENILSGRSQNIRSILVIKNGKLVVEEYFWQKTLGGYPYRLGRENGQNIYSATRTFTAALLGITLDQNLIAGVDENIALFFPEYRELFDSDAKKSLRLDHLLTMESGLRWSEAEIEAYQPLYDPIRSTAGAPIIAFLFGQPVITVPGKTYQYNNELSTVLGEIVRRRSGLSLSQFGEKYLFGPLGIKDYSWFTYPDGVAAAGNGLRLKPRDMAKFGLMILDRGRWKGKPLITEKWIDTSFQRHTAIGNNPYGYHWWLDTFVIKGQEIKAASARGHFGQFIFVVPSLSIAAVFTSASDESHRWDQPVDMMARYILPAAVSRRKIVPAPQYHRTGFEEMKKLEGIYRFSENRFGIIGLKGKSLRYKPPDQSFSKINPTSGLNFVSRNGNLSISFDPDGETGTLILSSIYGNILEQGIRLKKAPGGKTRGNIFYFPKTLFFVFFWTYAMFFLTGTCGYLHCLYLKAGRRLPLSGRKKINRPAAVWASMSVIGSLVFVRLLLDSRSALEEIINLGTYSFGWDERLALLAFVGLTLGLVIFALRLWLRRSGTTASRMFHTTLALVGVVLTLVLWVIGLFPLLLTG